MLGKQFPENAIPSFKAKWTEITICHSIYISAYDDVERKTREMVEPAEAKRKLVPDEERKSLSQLYEQEFLQVSQTLHG